MLNTHQAMERLGCAFGTIGQLVDAGVLPDRAERIPGAQKHHARFLAKDIAALKAAYQPRCHLALQLKVLKAATGQTTKKPPKTNGHGPAPSLLAAPVVTVAMTEDRQRQHAASREETWVSVAMRLIRVERKLDLLLKAWDVTDGHDVLA